MKKSNLIIVSELNREDVTLDEFKKLVAEGKIHLDRFMADSLEHEDALADLDQQTRAAVEAMEEEFLHPQPDQAKILKAQVAKLTSEIEGLKNGKAQIVTAKKEAEAKAKAAEGKLAEAEAKAKAAEGKLAEAEAKAKAAEGKLAEAEAKAEAAEGKLAKAEAKAKAAETKLAETEKKFGEIHDAGKAIQQLTAEKEKLSSELAEAQDKISELMKSRSSKSAAVSSVFDDTPDVVEVEDSENGILSRAYVVYDGNPINSEYAKRVLADFDKKFKPNDFELYFFKNINGRVKLTRKTGDNVTDI